MALEVEGSVVELHNLLWPGVLVELGLSDEFHDDPSTSSN